MVDTWVLRAASIVSRRSCSRQAKCGERLARSIGLRCATWLTGLRDIPDALLVDAPHPRPPSLNSTPAQLLATDCSTTSCATLELHFANDHHVRIGVPLLHISRQSSVVMDTFRFRLNCIDHYQATPTDLDPLLRRNAGLSERQGAPQVPVIRAFGATETGQKVCAHIHGALPYLYLEYNGSLEQGVGRLWLCLMHRLS
jgi:hypothetical protein